MQKTILVDITRPPFNNPTVLDATSASMKAAGFTVIAIRVVVGVGSESFLKTFDIPAGVETLMEVPVPYMRPSSSASVTNRLIAEYVRNRRSAISEELIFLAANTFDDLPTYATTPAVRGPVETEGASKHGSMLVQHRWFCSKCESQIRSTTPVVMSFIEREMDAASARLDGHNVYQSKIGNSPAMVVEHQDETCRVC